MDVTQALKDTENALRDFVALELSKKLGKDWIEKCGVSEDRIEKWKKRKGIEESRQGSAVVEERLIYYADFYDLKTILKKNWQHFAPALGDWKSMEVWLSELERFRDPDAHRRELLPHQKNLIIGIAGEIRSRLVRYRSKQETAEDYFPRFESVRDNFGNLWTPERGFALGLATDTHLRPGDTLEFVATASDPLGEELEYGLAVDVSARAKEWQKNNEFVIRVTEKDVSSSFSVTIFVRSRRKYRARQDHDDKVDFFYTVLPPKQR